MVFRLPALPEVSDFYDQEPVRDAGGIARMRLARVWGCCVDPDPATPMRLGLRTQIPFDSEGRGGRCCVAILDGAVPSLFMEKVDPLESG